MVRRAIALWRELEARTGAHVFRQSGVLYAGPKTSPFLLSSLASAREHDVAIDELSREERRRLAPQLRISDDWLCFAEREGGYLFVEDAIYLFLDDAARHGAEMRQRVVCTGIDPGASSVVVRTSDGDIRAGACIVAAGAWAAELMPELAPSVFVERKTLHWFADAGALYTPEKFRPFMIEEEDGREFYGFPDVGSGVKLAEHTQRSPTHMHPDDVERVIRPGDTIPVSDFATRFCPGVGAYLRSVTCLYPMSEDGHFIIDRMPGNARVVIAAGLSGHGFKFAPAIGEALANMALGREQKLNWDAFALRS
jgi:glycine/D-amino acid oxidase-like deaminating enzyme